MLKTFLHNMQSNFLKNICNSVQSIFTFSKNIGLQEKSLKYSQLQEHLKKYRNIVLLRSQSINFSRLLELVMGYKMMLNCRGKYAALKICSVLYFSKTMKNSCKLTVITDSFRQFYQNQSVDGFDLIFEVHITFGFQSEVPHLFLN